MIQQMEGALPSESFVERRKEIQEYAQKYGIDFSPKTQQRWTQEAREIHQPAARRIKSSSADEFQAWENLVGAVENNAITWSAFFEAHRDMTRRRGAAYLDWARIPGNAARLKDALNNMTSKSQNKKTDDDKPQ
jgi:hypothetical protein